MVSRSGLLDIIAAADADDASTVSRSGLLDIIAAADVAAADDAGVAGDAGRWHRGHQVLRAARGWMTRRRTSKNLSKDLHVAVHNHAQSLRVDDEMLYTEDSRKKVRGQGAWKRWTVRAALRMAFCAPNICARTLAKTLYRASHSHCLNVRHSIARCTDQRVSQELRKLLTPERQHEYLIQTIQYDESTFRLVPHLSRAAPIPVQNASTTFTVRAAESTNTAEVPFTYSMPLKLGFMTSKYLFIMNSVV